MIDRIAAFVAREWCVPQGALRVEIEKLHGGLESTVALARVTSDDRPRRPARALVVKELPAHDHREARIYSCLWQHFEQPPLPRVFGDECVDGRRYLYLESLRRAAAWPWVDTERAAMVCRELARFHDAAQVPLDAFAWHYDDTLRESAESTLALAVTAKDAAGRRHWTRLGDLRRVVKALPEIRSRLLASGTTALHGDVHPGNVILRSGRSLPRIALIDWSRARVGSPLEDVASWLHSLGCWEPRARRQHDTLLRVYLAHRRIPLVLSAQVRTDYWLASVSNGLSGAIRFHLAVVADPAATAAQNARSVWALRAWSRVIRQGARLLSTSRGRHT